MVTYTYQQKTANISRKHIQARGFVKFDSPRTAQIQQGQREIKYKLPSERE